MDSWDFFIFSFFSLFFYLFPYLTPISLSLSQAFFAIATIAPMGVMTTLTITIVTPPTTSGHSENKREIKSPGQKIDRACGH